MELRLWECWHYVEYELVEDVILCKEGSSLDYYDPWDTYWAECWGHVGNPPHIQLVNRFGKTDWGDWPSEDIEKKVLEWCNEYGLLRQHDGCIDRSEGIGIGIFRNDVIEFSALVNGLVRSTMDEDSMKDAISSVNIMTEDVNPEIHISDNGETIMRRWSSPSLLGHLAMMVAQDLLDYRFTERCECGELFTSNNPIAKHCSSQCGNRVRQKAFQERKKKRTTREWGIQRTTTSSR